MKRADIIIIGIALALAGLIALIARPRVDKSAAMVAVVYLNDVEYARVSLSEPQRVTVEQDDGRVNIIEVTDEGVMMHSSTCKNQLCVEQGLVTAQNAAARELGNWIVCLPNGVSVELIAEGKR